jgi:hypothetical protein
MTGESKFYEDHRFRVIRARGDVSPEEIKTRLATTVAVVVGNVRTFRHQLLALALVELLARLFPRIVIEVDDDLPTHPAIPGERTVRELLQAARLRGHPVEPTETPAITVVIGHAGETGEVTVDALGWQSYVGTRSSGLPGDRDSLVPIGPLCAAARGAARVFQLVFDELLTDRAPEDDIYWSTLTYEVSDIPLVEPDLATPHTIEALLVGAGSVGGAALYAFRYTPDLDGDLVVVDPQRLEGRNYVRAILAFFDKALAGAVKVDVAKETLEPAGVRCEVHQTTLAEYVASRPRTDALPLILCAVDSIESRRSIQDCLPLEVIDAACDHERARVSGHVTDDGPCIYCMHIERVLDSKTVRTRLLANATGFTFEQTAKLLVEIGRTLTEQEITSIELHRNKASGAYAAFVGAPLAELYRRELLYGETALGADGDIAVASPSITALTGFLLAAEALKAGSSELQKYRLGSRGSLSAVGGARAVKYEEPVFSPQGALLQTVPRSPQPACLCNSPRRLASLRARYGIRAGA